MYGPEYVWILNPEAGTVNRWAELNSYKARKNDSHCTKEEFEVVANRTFLLAGNDLRTDIDTKTDSGLVRKSHIQTSKNCLPTLHSTRLLSRTKQASKCATNRLCACVLE